MNGMACRSAWQDYTGTITTRAVPEAAYAL